MHSEIEVLARRGPDGRTVLPIVRAVGQLAVRRTGAHRIHLVANAFGPLGGDTVTLRLTVEPGARLQVCTAAAAICLPAIVPAIASMEVTATVADDARLDLTLEPSVVAAGAELIAETTVELTGDARLAITERVVLGRHAEAPGHWTGTTRIVRDGTALLHTTVALGPGAPAWRPPTVPRAYATDLLLAPGCQPATSSALAPASLLVPVPGGRLATGWGDRLDDVLRDLDRVLDRPTGAEFTGS